MVNWPWRKNEIDDALARSAIDDLIDGLEKLNEYLRTGNTEKLAAYEARQTLYRAKMKRLGHEVIHK